MDSIRKIWFPGIFVITCLAGSLLMMAACSTEPEPVESITAAAPVTSSARTESVDWPLHGLDDAEQRFSTLDQIHAGNVDKLGLSWYFNFGSNRGLEATPIVIDGVMYLTGTWSRVYAFNAVTGELLWQFDPEVPGAWAINACCDVVNRGVAVADGKVFVGTLDGRLIALNAASGEVVWETLTIDQSKRYAITGAPRVVRDKVFIGNGGAEFAGVRGYVSAYHIETGEMFWRFYTVPGDPSQPFENPILEQAAETWTGEWWALGGGGTVWDSMAYDAELDLLYIGIGNGSPWNQFYRSPQGGDNLFLASIVALRPDTGEYAWHYQTTPGETWDFTATQHMILADLEIEGTMRKVIMQAPKNGFFYVLDRQTGELISTEKYVTVNWASHVDMETGRPVEDPQARYYNFDDGPQWVIPGAAGGHNWQPMSYNPVTGLVYIPAIESGMPYMSSETFKADAYSFNTGTGFGGGAPSFDQPGLQGQTAQDQPAPSAPPASTGHLLAWDPVTQQEVWRVDFPERWNGGVLSTAGNLVFHGNIHGEFVAYAADTGARLWSFPAQSAIIAPPVTYMVDGVQYVTIVAGWGGAAGMSGGPAVVSARSSHNIHRVLTFRLQGDAVLPDPPPAQTLPEPPQVELPAESIARGEKGYAGYCAICHGVGTFSGGVTPDLRYSPFLDNDAWFDIVNGGLLESNGMVSFAEVLSREDAADIRAYVIRQAQLTWSDQQKTDTAEE